MYTGRTRRTSESGFSYDPKVIEICSVSVLWIHHLSLIKKMFKLLSLWMKGIITNHKHGRKPCVYYFYTNLKHYGYIRPSSWFRQWKIIKLCYFKLYVRLFTSTVNINHTGKIWDTERRNIFHWKTYIV